ncbi:DNA-binding PadR family transcriptional regulator [Aurantimicrobium minutum]|uniref:PadR family transcriptional regulator n=1 Tax=Aurantimicrobium minutum TaxID=708131 RepID=UPI0024740234|nr:PadR family transcriptional regulator [Aurantimicrobium minutum]MDH6278652.1 DNA-binding PadR family transcriptional regulator [Aurantimicrobium minutum]
MKNSAADWSIASALQTIEELGGQFKRNVDMRMRKGDVRSAVLRLLNESPMHGYQIISEIDTRSDGAWKPSPGSVYPTLQMLVDEGLLDSKETKGRRTYSLTSAGVEVAAAEADKPAPWETGFDRPTGPRGTLAMSGVKIAKAAAEVARVGSPEQMEKAAKIIDDAAKKLSAIVSHN